MATADFIVVGGGAMGVSTSLALQENYSQARIILFEGLATETASKDNNKVVRTPYLDEDISRLAQEAQDKWKDTFPYQEYYHERPWIRIISESNGEGSLKSKTERVITPDELMEMVGSEKPPQVNEGDELWINEDVAYVDAAQALEATAARAADLGVSRRKEDISQILVQDGVCQGVKTPDGYTFLASTVVIAAGAWTPVLLKNSNIRFPYDFFQPTAIMVGLLALTKEELDTFRSIPILVTGRGEIMPPNDGEGALKVTTTQSFSISDPGALENESLVDASPLRTVLRMMMPQLEHRPLKLRHCPELMTPDQFPVIDRAPGVNNLIVAAGCSYHMYKFLPVLGDLVVRLILGGEHTETLHDRVILKCSWKRPANIVALNQNLVPRHKQA